MVSSVSVQWLLIQSEWVNSFLTYCNSDVKLYLKKHCCIEYSSFLCLSNTQLLTCITAHLEKNSKVWCCKTYFIQFMVITHLIRRYQLSTVESLLTFKTVNCHETYTKLFCCIFAYFMLCILQR